MFYNQAKRIAIDKLRESESKYNEIAEKANTLVPDLYRLRKSAALAIDRIEKYINSLANTPKEFSKDIDEVKTNIKEFNEAVRIENENSADNIIGATAAGGGVALGGAVAALGPTTVDVSPAAFITIPRHVYGNWYG